MNEVIVLEFAVVIVLVVLLALVGAVWLHVRHKGLERILSRLKKMLTLLLQYV